MQIFQLAQLPEHSNTVGAWIYNEWWRTPDNSSEIILSKLRDNSRLDTIPFTVIAVDGNEVIGTCSVIEDDCAERPHLTPWIAAVVTREDRRGEGVASRLLKEGVKVVSKCNVEMIYLVCTADMVPFYESNGWCVFEQDVGDKKSTIMNRRTYAEQDAPSKNDSRVGDS